MGQVVVHREAIDTGTGNQTFTATHSGPDFTPVAAIFIVGEGITNATPAAEAVLSVGFTDGTVDVCLHANDKDAVGTTDSMTVLDDTPRALATTEAATRGSPGTISDSSAGTTGSGVISAIAS